METETLFQLHSSQTRSFTKVTEKIRYELCKKGFNRLKLLIRTIFTSIEKKFTTIQTQNPLDCQRCCQNIDIVGSNSIQVVIIFIDHQNTYSWTGITSNQQWEIHDFRNVSKRAYETFAYTVLPGSKSTILMSNSKVLNSNEGPYLAAVLGKNNQDFIFTFFHHVKFYIGSFCFKKTKFCHSQL